MAREKPLTEKQTRFCHEYVKDFNGAQAVLRAGYKTNNPDVIAEQLLSNTKLQKTLNAVKQNTYYKPNANDRRQIYERMQEIGMMDLNDLPKSLRGSDVITALKWLWEVSTPKQMPILEAVNMLVSEGVATPEQVEIVTNGIADIEKGLRGLSSGNSAKD